VYVIILLLYCEYAPLLGRYIIVCPLILLLVLLLYIVLFSIFIC